MDIGTAALLDQDGRGEPGTTDWSSAARDAAFLSLIACKIRRVGPAVALYLATYLGISVLAGFAPQFMATKLFGAVSNGYALILLTYLVAWGVALWYVRTARCDFDPLKAEAVRSIHADCTR